MLVALKEIYKLLMSFHLQKGLKNVFDEAILTVLEPQEKKKQTCVLL